MDAELESLLNAAKQNANPVKDDVDIEKIVQGIPKLENNVKLEKEQAKPKDTKLKDISIKPKKTESETAGKMWFDLAKPEMTPQLQRDLQLLKMRHVLDPKRFYKKEDQLSPYFAVGTIKESPDEFYSARLTKKQRKQSLAQEILATRSDYFKSKYRDIQKAKTSGRRKHQKKVRDMRL